MQDVAAKKCLDLFRTRWCHRCDENSVSRQPVSNRPNQRGRGTDFTDGYGVYPDDSFPSNIMNETKTLRPASPVRGISQSTPDQTGNRVRQQEISGDRPEAHAVTRRLQVLVTEQS